MISVREHLKAIGIKQHQEQIIILMHLKMILHTTACDTLESLKVIGNKNYSKQLITVTQLLGAHVIPIDGPSKDIEAEELDLERTGAGKDLVVTNLEYELFPVFQRMTDALHLMQVIKRKCKVEYIKPSLFMWNIHIDKLEKWQMDNPHSVYRFMIMLNDWEPGHFIQYGNFIHTHYRAGEIYSFDWYNTSHCTANAGRGPRCTLLVTGVATEATHRLFSTYDNKIRQLIFFDFMQEEFNTSIFGSPRSFCSKEYSLYSYQHFQFTKWYLTVVNHPNTIVNQFICSL